jgi:hypothetical protein
MTPPKTKTSLDVNHSEMGYSCRITNSCVINVNVDLNFDMIKGYWRFVCDWRNLIHDDICQKNGSLIIPYNLVILSFFYDDDLDSVTKVWQKFTQDQVHWYQVAIMVFLVHSLPDQLWVINETLGVAL